MTQVNSQPQAGRTSLSFDQLQSVSYSAHLSEPPSFFTDQGRLTLFHQWETIRIAQKRLDAQWEYTVDERAALLADWFCWCVEERVLDPHKRLPPYAKFASLPFELTRKQVTCVIGSLREKHILPTRKTRKDKDEPQWTPRDMALFELIGQMWAMRVDQVSHVLARLSPSPRMNQTLSASRTSEIIERWTARKYAVYRQVYYHQPGWIYLTDEGLKQRGLDFRVEAPSDTSLEHLFWVNEVRLRLEEEYPTMRWVSERSIKAQQERRRKGQRVKHTPDGILVIAGEFIDIEVQVSRPTPEKVREVMGPTWGGSRTNPLHYYVNSTSRRVVRAIYRAMVEQKSLMRPHIEIIDLDAFLQRTS